MGWRFRKSKKLFPGVRLNVSKRGLGLRLGPKNLGVSIGPSGTRVGGSIPGTGLSYSKKVGSQSRSEPMAAGMVQANCPECGNLNQHRQGSEGLLLKCQHCGHQYQFTITRSRSGCSAWGCLGAVAVILLAVFVAANLPMPSSPAPQPSQAIALPQGSPKTEDTPEQTPMMIDADAVTETAAGTMSTDKVEPVMEKPEKELAAVQEQKAEEERQARQDRIDQAVAKPDFRDWTSKDGKFKVFADLVKIKESTVVLYRFDKTIEVEVPLEKLSDTDNEYVKNLGNKK